MIKVIPFWQSNPIEYLVRARFPMARFEDTVILDDRNADPERQRAQSAAEVYLDELQRLDPDEIARRVAAQRKIYEEAARRNAEREEQARPFNRPEARADFRHWSKMSYWTIDETVALSLGREPKFAAWSYVQTLLKISPFAAEFAAKREVVMRAKAMGQLWDSTVPAIFLAWAERMKVEVPEPLVEAVRDLGFQIADWKTHYDKQVAENQSLQAAITKVQEAHLASQKSHSANLAKMTEDQKFYMSTAQNVIEKLNATVSEQEEKIEALSAQIEELAARPLSSGSKGTSTRERESLLKLIIGMAIKGYTYDPKAGRSPTVKEIASDLALIGLPLDEDTVRKYLAEAKQILPGDETEQNR